MTSIYKAIYVWLFISFLRAVHDKFIPVDDEKLSLNAGDVRIANGCTLVCLGFEITKGYNQHRLYIPVKVVNKPRNSIECFPLDQTLSKVFPVGGQFDCMDGTVVFHGAFRYTRRDLETHIRKCLVDSVEGVPQETVTRLKRAIYNII